MRIIRTRENFFVSDGEKVCDPLHSSVTCRVGGFGDWILRRPQIPIAVYQSFSLELGLPRQSVEVCDNDS